MSKISKNAKFGMVYFRKFKNEDIVWGLLILGREVDIIDTDIAIESNDDEAVSILRDKLIENRIDVAISYNFSPALSDACMKLGILYICWAYDAPIQMLFEKQVTNNCNYIFSFDRKQIEQTKKMFNCNIHYLPLGTNTTRNNAVEMTQKDRNRFSCDVSFIGNLYSENEYKLAVTGADSQTKDELDNLIEDAFGKWDGNDRLYGCLSEKTKSDICRLIANETSMDLDTFYSTVILVRVLAHRERIEMIRRLAVFDLGFYSNDTSVEIPGVLTRPPVNYLEELPNAYRFSKINMNLTMRGITSGVPLRVFDIMGVGGFSMTNYQPDVDELFSPGKDIEVYHSFDEMVEKVEYYLRHDDVRQKIAFEGARTISENYTIEKQVGKMLEVIG